MVRPDSDPPDPGAEVDPWESGRAAARAEVAAVFAPKRQTCPACGREALTAARTCPHCGAPYVVVAQRRRLSRRQRATVGALALALIAGAALLIPHLHQSTVRFDRAQARKQAALEAAERRRLTRDVQPHRAAGTAAPTALSPGRRLAARRALLARAQASITRDARARVRRGLIDGPIAGTQCDPFPSTPTRRAAENGLLTARYECIAFKSRVQIPPVNGRRLSGVYGFPFWVVIDYPRGTYVWCKVTPGVGEGGRSLAVVPVPKACRDPALQ